MVNDDEFMLAPSGDAFYVRDRRTPRVVAFDGTEYTEFPEVMGTMHVVGWR